jgi:serine/arginine repetitive matrix protein 2
MFGNVGIPSAKGTGTNGYVERALGYLPKDYKPGSYGEIIRQMKANPAPIKRKINDDIILHEEKHKIEVQLYDLKEKYENENKYTPEEIIEKINSERKKLYKLLERREADFMDKNETHQKGKLKDAQMKIIRDALKIKKEYNLGEGFEFTLQTDENKKLKKEHKKKHHKHHHEHKENSEDNDKYDYKIRKKKYWRSKGYRNNYSHSRSRSRSRSRSNNYNKNIRNELNNDYQNKKIKLVESAFKKSPSPLKNENILVNKDSDINKEKLKESYDEKDKIENDKDIDDKVINNSNNKEIKKEADNYEHEEGSLGEDEY